MNSVFDYKLKKVFPYALRKVHLYFIGCISNFFMRFRFLYWNVEHGKNNKFYGLLEIEIHPNASVSIGSDCVFRSHFLSNNIGLNRSCFLSAGRDARIVIGDSVGMSSTVIAARKNITIGSRVMFGANVVISDSDRHPLDKYERAKGATPEHAEIFIGNDVWLGMNVVVLKGVIIGEGTVVAANSVVTKSLPANVIAAGVPAKVIKKIQY